MFKSIGYVYLIEDSNNNTYKIGVTKGDPKKRLKKTSDWKLIRTKNKISI